MRTTIVVIIIILVVFFGFLIINSGDSGNVTDEPAVEVDTGNESASDFDKAPDFNLEDIDGNTVSLDDFSGKTLVINSWATWCPFCVDELPDFAELQSEFGDDIVMIAINRQESLNKSKTFTDNLGVTDGMLWLLDPRDSFYKSIGGFSMPETIFVDGEQNIRIHKRGPMELDEMISRVNSILN